MEKCIYKSEGMSSGAYKAQLITSIIVGIIGIFCLYQGFQKRSFLEQLVRGSNANNQMLLIALGIVAIIAAILQIATTITMNKSKIYVYSDHVEGVSSSKWLPFTKNFDLKYNQITDIKYVSRGANRYVYLFANGVKYTVPVSGKVEDAYNAINQQRNLRNINT